MQTRTALTLLGLLAVAVFAACVPLPPPTASAPQPTTTETAASAGRLFVFSNSSPHISVIDTGTHTVVATTDLPAFTSWTWNDDNNYFDGQNLWLGLRDPDTNDVEVITLNLDTLEVVSRLPLGQEKLTLYIGKATADGALLVSKMDSDQVVAIDTTNFAILNTWDVPVNGDVACDADIAVGSDGVERFYYPTRKGDTLVSLEPNTGEVLKMVDIPKGSTPLMLTTAPDNTVWVQETDSNTNAVFDPVTLELKGRFLTGQGPIIASFSQDGRYGFIGHSKDTIVSVIDAITLEEITRVPVGAYPQKLAVHPSGNYVYAILTEEGSVAVIDSSSWEVAKRIPLGTNPSGIYMEQGS